MKLVTRTHMKGFSESLKEEKKLWPSEIMIAQLYNISLTQC